MVKPSFVAKATSGPRGLRGWPAVDSQYNPFCLPGSLMNFCAYCFAPSWLCEKYSFCPSAIAAHTSMAATNVTELINLAKAKPKQLIYGSGGVGNITHLEMELLQVMTGIQMIHVPYKGSAPSVIGLMGGEVNMIFSSVPAALAQIKSGRMKALAVSTLQRSSALPDVPTLNESGLPGYDAASWYGLFAPAGTPKKILAALSGEVVKIMRVPDVRERFAGDGFEPAGQGPAEFAKFLREEIAKWARVVKTADIKPE